MSRDAAAAAYNAVLHRRTPSLTTSACQESRKRKFAAIEDGFNNETATTFQALISHGNASSVSHSFDPIATIFRAHLPFSWISNSSSSDLPPAAIVRADITFVSSWECRVLIARRIANGGLHLFEKVDVNSYICWPLHGFVSDTWIAGASIGASPHVDVHTLQSHVRRDLPPDATSSRPSSPIPAETVKVPKNRKGAAARLSILSPADIAIPAEPASDETPIGHSTTVLPISDPVILSAEPQHDISASTTTRPDTQSAPALPDQDLLAPPYLRQRYLETLYVAKTSLAYYAKGPLSRARARARAPDSSMNLIQLASFYRDSLLPPKRMDLKYKQSVQAVIQQASASPIPSADDQPAKPRRKSQKLTKTGLWPDEPQFISRWWASHPTPAATSLQAVSSTIQRATFDLRMREAEMQMMMMLEALAIEAKETSASKPDHDDSPVVKVESFETDEVSSTVLKKTKKPRNLVRDVEMLADNLCIWHSIGLESSLGHLTNDTSGEDTANAQGRDRLGNFCRDVVVPFYSSKLPELCKRICRTLAGSDTMFEPQKLIRTKIQTAQPLPPGSVVKRRPPTATARALERVLSEDLTHSPPPILSSRSLSGTVVPQFRREASEISQRPHSRGAVRKSMSFTNREIDLVTDARSTATKKRKLEMVAEQKRELDAAILALKKPNRTQAGKLYMDEVEARSLDSGHVQVPPVQITATPRAERRRTLDMANGAASNFQGKFVEQPQSAIPQSAQKPAPHHNNPTIGRSSSQKKAVLAAIFATPSKKASGLADPSIISSTCRPKSRQMKPPNVDHLAQHLLDTPSKQVAHSLHDQENGIPEAASRIMERAMRSTGAEAEASIYDSLGWNDDYDI